MKILKLHFCLMMFDCPQFPVLCCLLPIHGHWPSNRDSPRRWLGSAKSWNRTFHQAELAVKTHHKLSSASVLKASESHIVHCLLSFSKPV